MQALLDKTPVLSILPPKRTLIAVSAQFTLEKSLDVLTRNALMCAPVMREVQEGEDEKEDSACAGRCLGFLDMVNLCSVAVDIGSDGDISRDKIDDALSRAHTFLSKKVQVVVDRGILPYHGVNCAAPVSKALACMLENNVSLVGVERSGRILSTVQLSDIVELVARGHAGVTRPDQPSIPFAKDLLGMTLADTKDKGWTPFVHVGQRQFSKGGSLSDGVLVVKETDSLLSCFGAVVADGAVGVVDEQGRLCGNVSAWDLKFINRSLISLGLPISLFLQTVREKMMAPSDYLVTAKLTTTVGTLLTRFAEHHVDRIYVVDKKGEPIGVVTNAQLLSILKQDM